MSDTDTLVYFGKHNGKQLRDVPGGYLRWMVDNLDPVPLPKYRFHEDGKAMTIEEVDAMTVRMRNFISQAEDEILSRDE